MIWAEYYDETSGKDESQDIPLVAILLANGLISPPKGDPIRTRPVF
jgi:hypothetical protein